MLASESGERVRGELRLSVPPAPVCARWTQSFIWSPFSPVLVWLRVPGDAAPPKKADRLLPAGVFGFLDLWTIDQGLLAGVGGVEGGGAAADWTLRVSMPPP